MSAHVMVVEDAYTAYAVRVRRRAAAAAWERRAAVLGWNSRRAREPTRRRVSTRSFGADDFVDLRP